MESQQLQDPIQSSSISSQSPQQPSQSPNLSQQPHFIPREPCQVSEFLEKYPTYDGRGITCAIFDTGVDVGTKGLLKTSEGKPKIVDAVDCTGSGDVEMKDAAVSDDGQITLLSGRKITPPSHWKNPSGKYRVGIKHAYELFPAPLKNRLSKERKEKFQVKHKVLVADLNREIFEAESNEKLKKDLESQLKQLRAFMKGWKDIGPVLDCIAWNDGNVPRAVILSDEQDSTELEELRPMTDYYRELQYATFSQADLMNYSFNFYDQEKTLSIVTACGSHGSHVAGIVAACYPDNPSSDGLAPGAQIVSIKIGDSRLGSMETITGLVRGLIAAKRAGCQLINMSYGEPDSLPNKGRFPELANKLIHEHGMIFVSSGGNDGPAFSTSGAPGSTTTGMISVSAHVTPEMVDVQYSLRKNPENAMNYTWSSRGPSQDGMIPTISAPGGAIAPVPTYTLFKNLLMNGTSMSSPHVAGQICLMLSGLQQNGRDWNPDFVKRALQNTAKSAPKINPLSLGYGLAQTESAFEYMMDFPYNKKMNMWFDVDCVRRGTKGIYLREYAETHEALDENIRITPRFQKDLPNINKLSFEKNVSLVSNASWVDVPNYVHLTGRAQTFNILVDPTKLQPGHHIAEIIGIDQEQPSAGPLFRIPVTVIKPEIVSPTVPITWNNIVLKEGAIERRFFQVPPTATKAVYTIKTGQVEPESQRALLLHTIQLDPHKTFEECEFKKYNYVRSYSNTQLTSNVIPGRTLEVCLAQYWSNIGKTPVSLTVEFKGLSGPKTVFADPSAPIRIENCLPKSQSGTFSAKLNQICQRIRPSKSTISSKNDARNLLFTDELVNEMILEYSISLKETGDVLVKVPAINDLLYESQFESQLMMFFDKNKKIVKVQDAKPEKFELEKGTYTVRLQLRHENLMYLEKHRDQLIELRQFISKLPCKIYGLKSNALLEESPITKPVLFTIGKVKNFYLKPAVTKKVKQKLKEGMWLEGTFSSAQFKAKLIQPVLPSPSKTKKSEPKDERTIKEQLSETIMNAKIKFAEKLLSEKKEEEFKELLTSMEQSHSTNLKVLQLSLKSKTKKENKTLLDHEEIVVCSDLISKCIDTRALAVHYGTLKKTNADDDDKYQQLCKKKDEERDILAESLNQKLTSLFEMHANADQQEQLDKTMSELKKWVDTKKSAYAINHVRYALLQKKYGEALDVCISTLKNNSIKPDQHQQLTSLKIDVMKAKNWKIWQDYDSKKKLLDQPASFPLF